jgi:hypothetical protein
VTSVCYWIPEGSANRICYGRRGGRSERDVVGYFQEDGIQ